jgi:chorismate dehydratase
MAQHVGYRIGTVPWLNAVPLVAGLAERAQLTAALPGDLSAALVRGELDAALLPVAEAARGVGEGWLGRHGIASEGRVASVLLFLRKPLPEVRTLVLDPASRTSAALTRHLVAHATAGRAQSRLAAAPGPDPGAEAGDAVLVIGDPARRALASWRGEVLDLGEAWTARTGLPFVFARWRGRAGLGAGERRELGDLLDEAADRGLPSRAELAREWARRHGQDVRQAVEYVQRFVRYRIGPREEEALERFLAIVRADDAAEASPGAPGR